MQYNLRASRIKLTTQKQEIFIFYGASIIVYCSSIMVARNSVHQSSGSEYVHFFSVGSIALQYPCRDHLNGNNHGKHILPHMVYNPPHTLEHIIDSMFFILFILFYHGLDSEILDSEFLVMDRSLSGR